MNYAIVEFTDDDIPSVDIIPCNWLITDDLCFWPPYRTNRLNAAVRKREQPLETWSRCAIRKLHCYATYEVARLKVRKAEDTSSLETDYENVDRSRQKRRKPVDSDSEEQEYPVKKRPISHKDAPKQGLMALPALPGSLTAAPRSSTMTVHHTESHDVEGDECLRPIGDQLTKTSTASAVADTPIGGRFTSMAAIMEKLLVMESQLRQLSKLSTLEAEVRQLTRQMGQVTSALQTTGDGPVTLPDGVVLPVKTLTQLMDIETLLDDEENVRKMVRYLGGFGGKDVAETTRNIMKAVMLNAVATKMNFAGRGRKTGIAEMKMMNVVVEAARRNRLLKKVSRAEVESVVKLWLRYAADRSGGRRAREHRRRAAHVSDTESDD